MGMVIERPADRQPPGPPAPRPPKENRQRERGTRRAACEALGTHGRPAAESGRPRPTWEPAKKGNARLERSWKPAKNHH